MTAAQKLNLISVEDYLAGETEQKYEYFGGRTYLRPEEQSLHNTISVSILGHLHHRLRERSCRPYTSAMRVRLQLPGDTRFYHPDVSVVCRSNGPHEYFQDHPAVIFEVLSKKTRRIDQVEKYDAYVRIPSLRIYALVEQEWARVVIHRRTPSGFIHEVYDGMDAVLPLPEIEIELPLAEIYEGAELTPEPEEEEFRVEGRRNTNRH
jgi:Uma2 family endonuclease